MDGEEEDFVSGRNSDDGGGTPVQDELPGSDGGHQSEDDGSNNGDAPKPMEGGGSDDEEEQRRGGGSDDEEEQRKGGGSDSEEEQRRGEGSDDEEEQRKGGGSDDEEEQRRRGGRDDEEAGPRPTDSDSESSPRVKRSMSGSEDESPSAKHTSDNEEGGGASPAAKRRASSSDMEEEEEGKKKEEEEEEEERKKADSDSENDKHHSDSETETPAERKAAQIDSEGEGGEGGGKWKAVMQSDSEEEEEEGKQKKEAGSDGEQQKDDSEDEKPVKRKNAILSDSEEEDEEKTNKPVKRSRAMSDEENSDRDGHDDTLAKLRELGSDSSDEEEGSKVTEEKKDEKALFGSDSESGEGEEEEKMIADIFGESGDEEEEEFTGFNQEDLEEKKEAQQEEAQQEDSDSDEGVDRSGQDMSMMSDFDVMLAKRKAMNSRKRRNRDGGTFISDADDVVSAMISKMNEAAEEDRTLNALKKPALKKLTLLPHVILHLRKQDLKETFIDSGVMSAIKEWISPLPDKSLPALRIRGELLRILQELPSVSQETLKHSGIGRSVMFLYKHPKESRANKDLALKLINEWSRPIFGLTSNYKAMTREERQQRDLDQQMPQKQRLSSGGQTPRRDLEKQLTGEEKALRPGDPGFCARARVPMPSNKDYVVRPKWNIEMESNRLGPLKKGMSRVDKQMRRIADIRRMTKPGHAVKISVQGNHMPL